MLVINPARIFYGDNMKILICDDNLNIVEEVKGLLADYAADKNIAFDISTFDNGQATLESSENYNIAVLDVEMPDMNGIMLGEALRRRNKQTVLIFLTAHSQYLDSALNLNAARFFEKPINKERFFNGIDNALERIDNSTVSFYIRDDKAQVRITADSIIYIEIEHRKTKIVTEDKTYCTTHTLDYFKDRLISSLFAQPHKSYIINFNFVTAYERSEIMLNNKYKIPVSRSKQTAFRTAFVRFMEGK